MNDLGSCRVKINCGGSEKGGIYRNALADMMRSLLSLRRFGRKVKEVHDKMIRDEVMAMEDDALWFEVIKCLHGEAALNGYVVEKKDGRAWTNVDGEKVWREDRDYSNDITAALELAKEERISIAHYPLTSADQWHVGHLLRCLPDGEVIEGDPMFGPMPFSEIPRAIARIFILARANNNG